jgi:hypothetical protein
VACLQTDCDHLGLADPVCSTVRNRVAGSLKPENLIRTVETGSTNETRKTYHVLRVFLRSFFNLWGVGRKKAYRLTLTLLKRISNDFLTDCQYL